MVDYKVNPEPCTIVCLENQHIETMKIYLYYLSRFSANRSFAQCGTCIMYMGHWMASEWRTAYNIRMQYDIYIYQMIMHMHVDSQTA